MSVIEKKVNSLKLLNFENMSRHVSIGHFISTRTGGCSGSHWKSLNLSFTVGDQDDRVVNNRSALADALNLPADCMTAAKQVHGCNVKVVSRESRGRGAFDHQDAINGADALLTDVPGICLMVLLADCVPIFMYDPSKRVVGVVHAGWKGTLQMIAQKAVAAFQGAFGSLPQDIVAGIGPSIGPCCFKVGPEVIAQVEDVFGTKEGYVTRENRQGGYLDLWTTNSRQLLEAGLQEKNVEVAGLCTCENTDQFFSHRCESGKTGRHGAGIFLK